MRSEAETGTVASDSLVPLVYEAIVSLDEIDTVFEYHDLGRNTMANTSLVTTEFMSDSRIPKCPWLARRWPREQDLGAGQ